MNIDQIVVIGVVMVVIMSLFVSMIDYVIPTLKKMEFDATCRNYILLAESQNGLEDIDIDELKLRLQELGFEEIEVAAQKQNSVVRGNLYVLNIEAIYNQKKVMNIFKRIDEKVFFKFTQSYLARKIVM